MPLPKASNNCLIKVQTNLKFIFNQLKPSSDIFLFESTTSQPIEQVYTKLKKILLESKCKITAQESPKYIQATQGSIMGILPTSAKKVVSFHLSSEGSETKISGSSQISKDWKNLTLYGSIITAIVIGIFVWIAIDMTNYIEKATPSFWSWLAQIYLPHDPLMATLMVNLIQTLAIFLTLTIVFEILIVIYVYPRKNNFSCQLLEKIAN